MSMDSNSEYHYIGTFNILDEEIDGEIIRNKRTGVILLNLAKQLDKKSFFGKSYANIPIITGKINTGALVTLFNNRCIDNNANVGQIQRICFTSDYLIWSSRIERNAQFNELVCTLKNAFAWTNLLVFEKINAGIKMKEDSEERVFYWFGTKVSFSVFSNEDFFGRFDDEERTIVQRVKLTIVSETKRTIDELILIRDRIIAMISFAIKNNINIEEEYLLDYDDSYLIGDAIELPHKHYVLAARRELEIYDSYVWDYNFTLNQLSADKDINKELEKLVPIFNLYLSLFKYRDMPLEMIFLNIVQALETFHSRFFYGNKKRKYVESVMERFPDTEDFGQLKRKLLSTTQMDENCSYIILASRLNDLLIGNQNTLFYDYWECEYDYGQIIADTRHYYTHYGSSKEKKALKGKDLEEAIFVLSSLLEYHICLVLGIDIEDKIRQSLHNHNSWKQLEKAQIREME